jgi:hypothetical protein
MRKTIKACQILTGIPEQNKPHGNAKPMEGH